MWWTLLAGITFVQTLWTIARIVLGNRRIAALQDQDPGGLEHWPRLSIIVAARNEQANIRPALQSLLGLDYPSYDVIAVNDRSTDDTGPIIDALAEQSTQLTAVHLSELPSGWLGKNYAHFTGAERATGEYLLFTDADVVMHAQTLRHAMAYVIREQADHLTVSPDPLMPGVLLQSFVLLFVNLFAIFAKPWNVANPNRKAFIGIGAFNLVRREVYQAVGTHRTIAMRPDDDMKLGKIIKSGGFRQRVLFGFSMIRVPWYSSVGELIRGMEKNAFSGVDYRILLVLAATLALALGAVWPFAAVWVLSGWARALYGGVIALQLGRMLMTAHELRQGYVAAFLLPLAVVVMIYIQWRAMVLTFTRGGIRWRDTHYSLADLKANKV